MTDLGARPPVPQPHQNAELWLRHEWWRDHGGVNCLPYGDDGEMQCCGVDFKRLDLGDLHSLVMARRHQRMVDALVAAQAQPPVPDRSDPPYIGVEAHQSGQPLPSVREHEHSLWAAGIRLSEYRKWVIESLEHAEAELVTLSAALENVTKERNELNCKRGDEVSTLRAALAHLQTENATLKKVVNSKR